VPPKREQIDDKVRAFQALNTQTAVVLGTDGKLWLEHAGQNGLFGVIPPPREQIDGNVRAFRALDTQTVAVLGTDDKLWLEHAPFVPPNASVPPKREQIDDKVRAFQTLDTQTAAVLGTDGKLWLEHADQNGLFGAIPPRREQIDGKVRAFQALTPVGPFQASPIVVNDTVFVGNQNGYFYALDAATGTLKWQYPQASDPPLIGTDSTWSRGFQSSASYWGEGRAVIFGAQDPSLDRFGSSRLFALDEQTGKLIWKTRAIATINGDTSVNPGQGSIASLTELHQQISYSSPLIFNNKAYVGIHDTRDDPIQLGRIIAVDLATHEVDSSFHFQAVGTPSSPPIVHGGGIWNALAGDGSGVYFTTGNTRIPWCGVPYTGPNCPDPFEPEPSPNYGLSMVRVDSGTGAVVWHFNAVDFAHDGDPDWAAGAAVMTTTDCGDLITSVQKDGWSYALDASTGKMLWQFPPTGLGPRFLQLEHGDDDYRRPGAAWNDVFIVRTGGENRETDGVSAGYNYLHALNVCAKTEEDRVRWIANIPNVAGGPDGRISYSTPTVTGGIVFYGTNQDPTDMKGHLVVLGDPSVVPTAESICSNVDYSSKDCSTYGFVLVPHLRPLAVVAMPDGGSLAAIRNEPVVAKGRVFVATRLPNAGHVYMLEPRGRDE
jgi:outer membrane protein assembly factor BamB